MLLRHGLRALQIVLAAACAYLAYAGVSSSLVNGTALAVNLPAVEVPAAAPREPSTYGIIGQRDLFRTPVPGQAIHVPRETLAETQLQYRLRGTLAASRPGDSLAALENKASGERFYVRAGDRVEGASVERIERGRVVLLNGGELEALTMVEDGAPAAVGAGRAALRRTRPVGAAPSRRRASRSALLGVSRQPQPALASLLRQVTLRPALDPEGEVEGVLLESVQGGSPLAAAGLRAGAVCTELNDVPIVGVETLAGAFEAAPDDRVCLVCRDGDLAEREYCL